MVEIDYADDGDRGSIMLLTMAVLVCHDDEQKIHTLER